MSPALVVALVIVGVGVAVRAFALNRRRRLISVIRAKWGKPTDRLHKLDAIAAASRSRLELFQQIPSVDDRTWADLDLDDVFAAIDRTESTLGQQALYHRLHIWTGPQDLSAFEALITRLDTDVAARERAQAALARLQDNDGYNIWWLAQPNAIEGRRWHIVFPILTVLTVAMVTMTLFWHAFMPGLVVLLVGDLGVRVYAAGRVSELSGALRQIAPIVATAEALRFLEGDDIAPIVTPLRSDLAPLQRLKTISRWLGGDPFMMSLGSSRLEALVTNVAWAVYEYVNLVLLLDANAVFICTGDIRAHAHALVRLAASIGDVDTAIGVASWRRERSDWTRPHFEAPGSRAVLRDLRHPLVNQAVPNSVVLEPGRGLLVTGSNMSGKTTFLKAVGVNTVLAQSLNTCLASTFDAPRFRVQSCIGRTDDLIAGKSYYIVEVEQVLARVRASAETAAHLFLFDELFRGTNAVERIAAAEAVLRELVEPAGHRRAHVAMAATHDAELVELLDDFYDACHFSDTIGPQGLIFEYRLEPGPATTRNAITLLELYGAPPSVVRRALTRAAALDRVNRRANL
jgi:hypothetical protein